MHESSCIVDPSFFVVSLLCCQLVSSSLDCFPRLDARTLWLKFESSFIPWSSMHAVSVASDLFDFSILFISLLTISPITLLFLLLPDRPWHPGGGLCRVHQESSEQRSPNDSDYDDVTIGKTLSDSCPRGADHSREEGLSSCLSSSVSHDRKGRPVVLVHKFRAARKLRDTPLRVNRLGLSWIDQGSRFSLTVKQRFKNTNSRPITTEEVFKS